MLKRTISGLLLVIFMVFMIDFSEKTYIALWIIVAFLCLIEFGYLSTTKYPQRLGKGASMKATLGAGYILLCFGLLIFGFGNGEFGIDESARMMVLTIVTLIWTNDVGAYLVGMSIGKHKMCPKISPKKSWEGFFGGVIVAIGGAMAWYYCFWMRIPQPVEMLWINQVWFFAGLGLVVALGAVGGDLIESKFKRVLNIKDSGNIIPGHGGMLDRFDALMLAVPLAWIYIKLYFALSA